MGLLRIVGLGIGSPLHGSLSCEPTVYVHQSPWSVAERSGPRHCHGAKEA